MQGHCTISIIPRNVALARNFEPIEGLRMYVVRIKTSDHPIQDSIAKDLPNAVKGGYH